LYGEHLFTSLWQEHRIPTVSLRFFNVYGPRQVGTAYGFVVSIFINQALEGKPITVFGDGKQTRDFVHVSDNVNMTLSAADSKASWGEVMNIGSGREKSIIDLALLVNKVAGRGASAVQYLPARKREVDRRLAATEKFNQLVGVKSQVSVEEGIEMIMKQRQADDSWSKECLQVAAVEA
jgi:UDP-glucose 4-epimerase